MSKILNFAFLLIFLSTSSANGYQQNTNELPEYITTDWSQIQLVGHAKFTHFGLHIYDASFWSLKISKVPNYKHQATALSIQYARNISAERLLSSTYKEWRRLGFADQYPLQAWLESLKNIWPDVAPGDRLIFISNKDGSNAFYSNKKILGSIKDKRFSSAFLDIWLSPNAKYQKHRKELLGETS